MGRLNKTWGRRPRFPGQYGASPALDDVAKAVLPLLKEQLEIKNQLEAHNQVISDQVQRAKYRRGNTQIKAMH